MNAFSQKLRRLRKAADMTQAELAQAAQVSREYVASLETRQNTNPSREVILSLAKALGVPREELLAAAGYLETTETLSWEEQTRRMVRLIEGKVNECMAELRILNSMLMPVQTVEIPLLGSVPAGGLLMVDEAREGPLNIPASMVVGAKQSFELRVQGDSMANVVQDGDVVIVDPERRWTASDMIVCRVGSETTLKYVTIQNGMLRLEAANPAYPPIIIREQDVQCLGVVIGSLRLNTQNDLRRP